MKKIFVEIWKALISRDSKKIRRKLLLSRGFEKMLAAPSSPTILP